MEKRTDLVTRIVRRVRERFAVVGGVADAPCGEVNTYISNQVRSLIHSLDNPYSSVIADWEGQCYHLDLCWWEVEETPQAVVIGLAGAILDYEARRALQLPE